MNLMLCHPTQRFDRCVYRLVYSALFMYPHGSALVWSSLPGGERDQVGKVFAILYYSTRKSLLCCNSSNKC